MSHNDRPHIPPANAALIASHARLDFEATARYVYDRFLILQPNVAVEGLFREGREYFVVTPALDNIVNDGETLEKWFNDKVHPLAMPIYIARSRPPGAEEVPPRPAQDVLLATGTIRSWIDIDRDLSLALPRDLPFLNVVEDDRTAVLRFTRILSASERRIVESAFDRLGTVVPMRIEEAALTVQSKERKPPDRIELRTARRLPASTPQVLRTAVESDEDFWRRTSTLSSTTEAARSLTKAAGWPEIRGQSCLVATTFPPANIRSYLSLYSTVVLVAPTKEALEPTLSGLGISRRNLVELVQRGAVRLLVPQSIERYELSWLSELLEAAPEHVMLSRQLAGIAMHDQYRRNPLLSLPATGYERRAILRAMGRCADGSRAEATLLFGALANALSEYWDGAEYVLQVRGAMASLTGGLARFGNSLTRAIHKKDFSFEIGVAALSVEWASALGANIVPENSERGYSSENASGLLVALSTGVLKADAPMVVSPRQFDLAEELLVFDNDTDVLDFVSYLGAGDVARFRELIPSIARGSRSEEDLTELVRAWNAQVRAYERKPDRIRTFGVAGIALAAASQALPNQSIRTMVPLMTTLIPFLTTKLTEDTVRDSRLVGELLDWTNAAIAGTAPEAVLISRLRKRVAGMKSTP